MTMIFKVAGATENDLARGLRAAQAVLSAAGVSDVTAAYAAFECEGWDIVHEFDAKHKPTAATFKAAAALGEARQAALRACCAGWPRQPASDEWTLDVDIPPG